MPSNPKLYLPKRAYFVSSRTEQGLPFVAAAHLKLILEGILARATERFALKLCHQVWMGNHFHMIIVVEDPEALAQFLCFVKTESAHAINRMLGNRRRTVWCEGSDAPILLTADDVIERIAYLYANPASASLVDTIDEYPMLSSWEMYRTKRFVKRCPVITRDQIPKIGSRHLSLRHQKAFASSLARAATSTAKLRIHPYAWMECFPELADTPRDEIDKILLSRVRDLEENARRSRKTPVVGSLALQTQDMDRPHQPKKFSRKMICICSDKELRSQFISWVKDLFAEARVIYEAWKQGDFSLKYPPGLFPPHLPRAANMLAPL